MKAKYVIIPIVVILIIIGGYLAFNYLQNQGQYKRTSRNELNPSDFRSPGGINQIEESYTDGQVFYSVRIMEFSNEASATNGISELEQNYNPAMILLNKKYVYYKELGDPGVTPNYFYFYKSGKFIINIDSTHEKDCEDCEPRSHDFVIWYYSKYPNK